MELIMEPILDLTQTVKCLFKVKSFELEFDSLKLQLVCTENCDHLIMNQVINHLNSFLELLSDNDYKFTNFLNCFLVLKSLKNILKDINIEELFDLVFDIYKFNFCENEFYYFCEQTYDYFNTNMDIESVYIATYFNRKTG
jgi:hypothetical protein